MLFSTLFGTLGHPWGVPGTLLGRPWGTLGGHNGTKTPPKRPRDPSGPQLFVIFLWRCHERGYNRSGGGVVEGEPKSWKNGDGPVAAESAYCDAINQGDQPYEKFLCMGSEVKRIPDLTADENRWGDGDLVVGETILGDSLHFSGLST